MPFIFDIKRYAVNDGPGIRTTVFFKGCPLRCRWCHNPESQERKLEFMKMTRKLNGNTFNEEKAVGYEITSDVLVEKIARDHIFYDESGGGVTFSGGEPLMQAEALLECLKRCREKHISTCIDTAGAVKTPFLDEIIEYTDIFLYDIKTADEQKFKEYIGYGFDIVMQNCQYIADRAKRVIIRIPVIPQVNDDTESMNQIIRFMKNCPKIKEASLLPFHRTGADKYKRLGKQWLMGDLRSLTQEDLEPFKIQFLNAGYHLFTT